ncbi:MAG: hypothetical protein KGD64_15480, partial [Candidatus Heimdallarchaeota archaeon]|nr:hypothetical protein [Candidatus Heimdallarchaeota archaeon]
KIFEETGELRKKPNMLYFQGRLDHKNNNIEAALISYKTANTAAEELQNIEYMIKSQFQLANLYLEKFNETKELAYYSSVLNYINNLTFLSEEQFLPKLMCDLYLLKGRLLAQVGKRTKAVEDLLHAIEIAERFRYKSIQYDAKALLREIENDKFDEEEDLKILMDRGIVEADKISEILQKYEGFKFVKSPKQVDSKLQCVALVEKDTGVIRYRYTTKYEQDNTASIVPSLVAAVNMFSSQVFDEDIVFEELKEEDKELLIKHVEPYLLIIITDKITYNLKMQFERYAEEIKKVVPTLEPLGSEKNHQEILDKMTDIYFLKKTKARSELEESKKKIVIREKVSIDEPPETEQSDNALPTQEAITEDVSETKEVIKSREDIPTPENQKDDQKEISGEIEEEEEEPISVESEPDSMMNELEKAVEEVELEFKDKIDELKETEKPVPKKEKSNSKEKTENIE